MKLQLRRLQLRVAAAVGLASAAPGAEGSRQRSLLRHCVQQLF